METLLDKKIEKTFSGRTETLPRTDTHQYISARKGKANNPYIFFHPDYDRRLWFLPDLLTLLHEATSARGLTKAAQQHSPVYRRWGIPPRPEDVLYRWNIDT